MGLNYNSEGKSGVDFQIWEGIRQTKGSCEQIGMCEKEAKKVY